MRSANTPTLMRAGRPASLPACASSERLHSAISLWLGSERPSSAARCTPVRVTKGSSTLLFPFPAIIHLWMDVLSLSERREGLEPPVCLTVNQLVRCASTKTLCWHRPLHACGPRC